MLKPTLALLIAWSCLAGCQETGLVATHDAAGSLRDADSALSKAVAERDLGRILSFYADDAVLMPTAEPTVSGKAAIREEWEHILSIPDFANKSSLTKAEAASSGDFGYTMGTYVATLRGENGDLVSEPGKWLTVWKKRSDGSWSIVVDTYNTDIPPPDHK